MKTYKVQKIFLKPESNGYAATSRFKIIPEGAEVQEVWIGAEVKEKFFASILPDEEVMVVDEEARLRRNEEIGFVPREGEELIRRPASLDVWNDACPACGDTLKVGEEITVIDGWAGHAACAFCRVVLPRVPRSLTGSAAANYPTAPAVVCGFYNRPKRRELTSALQEAEEAYYNHLASCNDRVCDEAYALKCKLYEVQQAIGGDDAEWRIAQALADPEVLNDFIPPIGGMHYHFSDWTWTGRTVRRDQEWLGGHIYHKYVFPSKRKMQEALLFLFEKGDWDLLNQHEKV